MTTTGVITALLRKDVRIVYRDRFMLAMLFYPLLLALGLRFAVPLIPQLALHYGVSLSAAGWISGAFGLSYAVGFMIFGPLTEKTFLRTTDLITEI